MYRARRSDIFSSACLALFAAAVCFSFSGCNSVLSSEADNGSGEKQPEISPGPGSVLAQHGQYLYILGGRDSEGVVVGDVRMVHIRDDGTIDQDEWRTQTSLPSPREGASAFTLGDRIYLLGGRDESGIPREDIFFTRIDPATGRLGYGSNDRWARNPRSLPVGLTDAAWTIHQGRVFLVGGRTADGPSDKILHAGIYADGQVGHWYEATEHLSAPRWNAGAMVHERDGQPALFVAGGLEGSGGTPVNRVEVFPVGEYGQLSPALVENFPEAVSRPLLLDDGEELLLGGGVGGTGTVGWYRRSVSGIWSSIAGLDPPAAAGPSVARANGSISYLLHHHSDKQDSLTTQLLDVSPENPLLHPSSGVVPTNTLMNITSESRATVRYRIAYGSDSTGEVDPGDTEWTSGLAITEDMEIALRAFGPDGSSSSTTRHRYQVRSSDSFPLTSRLILHPEEPTTATTITPGWYFFETDGGSVTLSWSGPGNIRLSVFESDLYTPVIAKNGDALLDVQHESGISITSYLRSGEYYILLESSQNDFDNLVSVDIALHEGNTK